MDDILKGNFKVKREKMIHSTKKRGKETKSSIAEQLKKRALASLGGSMVYIERTKLIWEGK